MRHCTAVGILLVMLGTFDVSCAFATDSTTPNLVPQAKTAKYPVVSIPSSPVSNENYSGIWTCPTNPVCGDINNPLVGSATCPYVCKVNRVVNATNYGGGVVKINSTMDAVCPPGYAAVNTFNGDKEVIKTGWLAEPYPISTMVQYNSYKNAGDSCYPSGSSTIQSAKYCGNNPGFAVNGIYDNINPTNGNPQGVVQVNYIDSQCYSKGSSCTSPISCGVIHDRGRVYQYSYLLCMQPPGLSYSTAANPPSSYNTVTTSVVCTNVELKWN